MGRRRHRIYVYCLAAIIGNLFSVRLGDAQSSLPDQNQVSGLHFAQRMDFLDIPSVHFLQDSDGTGDDLAIYRSGYPDGLDFATDSALMTVKESEWELTFADEFHGAQLDRNIWSTEYGFDTDCAVANPPPPGVVSYCNRSNNNEKEWYIDDAPKVENGLLSLVARRNDCSGDHYPDRSYPPYSCENFPYTSGMVSTHDRFSQLYGYFEARIKVPKGQGLWPAFWIMPQLPPGTSPDRSFWPPEIDIMELKGQQERSIYMTHLFSGVYPDPGSKLNNWSYGGFIGSKFDGPDFSMDFHVYAMEWEPEAIIWYIDGVERFRSAEYLPPGRVSLPDYTGEMHLILNLAVGGTFVDNLLPDDSILPISMDVDYVRVYRKNSNEHLIKVFIPVINNASE